MCVFFFFKQKTAYEMRTSDWSSDVCSSDLAAHAYCHLDFKLEDGEPVLTGRVDYRYRHRSTKIDQRGAQVASLAQAATKRRAKRGHAALKLMPVLQSVFAYLGEFSCANYWFTRRGNGRACGRELLCQSM